MYSSYLHLFVFYLVISSVQSAPVNQTASTGTLLDIVQNDTRAYKKLKNRLFVKMECSKEVEFSEQLCLTFYDIALKFDQHQLNFTNSQIGSDEDFCKKLVQALPDQPDDSTMLSVKQNYKHSIDWIKDTFKKNPQKCEDECLIIDTDDVKAKPMCFFIYNQYKFLEMQQKEPKEVEKPAVSTLEANKNSTIDKNAIKVDDAKPVTTDSQVEDANAIIPILPANAKAVDIAQINQTTAKNVTLPQQQQQQPEESPVEVKPKEEKVATQPIPAVNKSAEVTKEATKTTKSDTTINTDDDQQNLNDNDVFDPETQSEFPEKTDDIDGNDAGIDPDEDEDSEYQPDLVRDNNRNVQNKFNNHLQLTEVEAPESDPRVRVESVDFEEDPDSNFFTYLCAVMFVSILLYILYHNRHKILALVLEGRRGSRRQRERSRGGSKAAYSKLDCNLEEAITSKKSLSGKSMDIIY